MVICRAAKRLDTVKEEGPALDSLHQCPTADSATQMSEIWMQVHAAVYILLQLFLSFFVTTLRLVA